MRSAAAALAVSSCVFQSVGAPPQLAGGNRLFDEDRLAGVGLRWVVTVDALRGGVARGVGDLQPWH